jgi:hypothetical protein
MFILNWGTMGSEIRRALTHFLRLPSTSAKLIATPDSQEKLMKYEQAKHLKPAEFKRFWGVKLETFKDMVEIVHQHKGRNKKTGRPGQISLEDQVLMTLEYWREYRRTLSWERGRWHHLKAQPPLQSTLCSFILLGLTEMPIFR